VLGGIKSRRRPIRSREGRIEQQEAEREQFSIRHLRGQEPISDLADGCGGGVRGCRRSFHRQEGDIIAELRAAICISVVTAGVWQRRMGPPRGVRGSRGVCRLVEEDEAFPSERCEPRESCERKLAYCESEKTANSFGSGSRLRQDVAKGGGRSGCCGWSCGGTALLGALGWELDLLGETGTRCERSDAERKRELVVACLFDASSSQSLPR